MKFKDGWEMAQRPGYFGRRRDEKIATFNALWGEHNWRLSWITKRDGIYTEYPFVAACSELYEESYYQYLKDRASEIDFICSFGECIDNDETNVESGLDYSKQESWATHIQDIAVRNVLKRLGRKFEDPNKAKLLVIRSQNDNGFRFNPGNVPFFDPELITQPSMLPRWAKAGSVEDFWQSNKWLVVKRGG